VIARIIERERLKKKRHSSAIRDSSDIPYASLQRDIRSLRNDQKLYPGIQKILLYPFSSLRCRRRRRRTCGPTERRSSLLSRIHTLFLLRLLLSSIPSSFSLSFIRSFRLVFSPPRPRPCYLVFFRCSYPVFRPDARVSFEKSRGQVIE